MRMVTKLERVQAAAEYMRSLIENGWEYPDAHSKASISRGVNPEELAEEYAALFDRPSRNAYLDWCSENLRG